MNQGIGYI
uniref:Uncharacterized protein n=1 Tax=Arundo donax TaxID=35708 RepID=A0A0A9C4T8_ARUDO